MKKIVQLTERELKTMIKSLLKEQEDDVNEYGRKGQWKPEWNEEDQMLAMYNSLYGIQELGEGKLYVAHSIIGTSVASFNQQSSNFDYLHTGRGLDRPNETQTKVYEQYKNMPKAEFKEICLEIIRKRKANPEEAVTKKKLGDEIGSKRDAIKQSRQDALVAAGVQNPKKMKLIRSNPLYEPDAEESEPVQQSQSEKNQIKDFLTSIVDRMRNIKSKNELEKLASDLEFVIEYMDDELVDKNVANMVAEMKYIFKRMI